MNNRFVDSMRQSLSGKTLKALSSLEAFREIGSTNSYLLAAKHPAPGNISVAIADEQTAGRGRRDNEWFSPPGAGLWMSVAYTFKKQSTNLSALTLAIGGALADELSIIGVDGISLKWPNDLLVDDRKLGGILMETCAGGMTAVAGIGINMALPGEANSHIKTGKNPVDLTALLPEVPSTDRLAARFVDRLLLTLQKFDLDGFESFVAGWSRHDALAGREIAVHRAGIEETGIAAGIAPDGALLLQTENQLQRIVSGSVRIVDCEEAIR